MIYIYRLIAYLIFLGTYPYGRYKAFQGDALWQGRLAQIRFTPVDIWLHAASVGEVRVVSYLITYLLQQDPTLRLQLTVMTRTGYQTAKTICPKKVLISFLPFDVPILWAKVLKQMSPKAVVVAETEIWPNLIVSLGNAGIPLVLVNGKLSQKSFERYMALRPSFYPLMERYDHFFVKGDDDLRRFIELGVAGGKMTMAGDMKFDAPLLERTDERRQEIRRAVNMDPDQYLLVAGSTREGEESQLVQLYCDVKARVPNLRMIIVPRHIERAGEAQLAIEQAGLTAQLLSEPATLAKEPIVVVDKMGILNDLYLAADLAFVGGTLVETGGHNLLEPVWAGTPVLFGPSIANVRDAAEYIRAHNYGTMAGSLEELTSLVLDVASGARTFATKTMADMAHSATAKAGSYILSRLHHA